MCMSSCNVVCLWCSWISNSTEWFIGWNNNSSHPLNTTNIVVCFIVSHPPQKNAKIQTHNIIIDDPFSYLIPLVSDKFLLLRGIFVFIFNIAVDKIGRKYDVVEWVIWICYINCIDVTVCMAWNIRVRQRQYIRSVIQVCFESQS